MLLFLLIAPLLAGQGLAAQPGSRVVGMGLSKRQTGDAFKPTTQPFDCVAAGFPLCGNTDECYNPKEGGSCCHDTYTCPPGSFCLQDGYCCPDGDDPETCARRYGITLSPSPTDKPVPKPTETSVPAEPTEPAEPTGTADPTESAPQMTTSKPVIPKPSSSAPPTIPTASPSTPLFTGGANARGVIGGAAIALGGLGMLGNLI